MSTDCGGVGTPSELDRLRAEIASARQSAQSAYRDSARLIRLLTVIGLPSAADELVDRSLSVLAETFAAAVTCVVQTVGDRVFPTGSCGIAEEDPAILSGWAAAGAAAQALASGMAVSRCPQPEEMPASLRLLGVSSAAWIPLAGPGGHELLILFRVHGKAFAPADLQILTSVARRLRMSIEARERSASIEQLARAGHRLARHLERRSLFSDSVALLQDVCEAEGAWVVSVQGEDAVLEATRGLTPLEPIGWPRPARDLPEWAEASSGVPVVRTLRQPWTSQVDVAGEEGRAHGADNAVPTFLLCVPVLRHGRVIALLYAARTMAGAYRADTAEIAGMFATYVASALVNAELYAALRQSEASLRLITESISDLVAVVTAERTYAYVSPSYARELAHQPDALLGTSILRFVHPGDRAGLETTLAAVQPVPTARAEYRIRSGDGEWVWLESCFRPAPSGTGMVVMSSRVVDERKRLENELRHQATHDPLTGLANRNLLSLSLDAALGSADGSSVGLLFCDLDKFKAVNDRLGHEAGDALLVEAAGRLRQCVRPHDLLARFGGDEFVFLLDGVASLADVGAVGGRVMAALEQPFVLDGELVAVSASVGGVLGHRRRTTASALLRDADAAMYTAKDAGRGRVRVFDDEASHQSLDRWSLRAQLSGALDRGELGVQYQPIYDLGTGRISGFEALVRWTHPERGPISPDVFIPVAEESGAIVQIGFWVLEEACARLASWHRWPGCGEVGLNVNLSPLQLRDPRLVPHTLEVLRRFELAPRHVCLEVTERGYMADDAVPHVNELRRAGVRFALDDFGVSYSNLGYLQRFPVECLKIDKSFVAEFTAEAADQRVVRAILAVGGSLGVDVVAEGIETEDQRRRLLALGCRRGQGYLLSRPLDGEAADALLRPSSSAGAVPGSGRSALV